MFRDLSCTVRTEDLTIHLFLDGLYLHQCCLYFYYWFLSASNTFFPTDTKWIDLALIPGLRGEKPETNTLSHGMTSYIVFLCNMVRFHPSLLPKNLDVSGCYRSSNHLSLRCVNSKILFKYCQIRLMYDIYFTVTKKLYFYISSNAFTIIGFYLVK